MGSEGWITTNKKFENLCEGENIVRLLNLYELR